MHGLAWYIDKAHIISANPYSTTFAVKMKIEDP